MEKFNTLATSLVTIMRAFGENIESVKSDVSETRADVEIIKRDISDIKAMLERLMVSAPQPIEAPSSAPIEAPSSAPIEEPVEEDIEEAPVSEASEPYDWRKDIGEEAPSTIEAAPVEDIPAPKRRAPKSAPIEAAPVEENIPAAPVSSPGEIRARFDALSTVQRRGIARAFLLTITPALNPDILRNPSNLSWEFCAGYDNWKDYVENAIAR